LVPAFRYRCDVGDFASAPLSSERVIDALRQIALDHPTGPLFGYQGVGAERWKALMQRRRLALPHAVYRAASRNETTSACLVRRAVGARAAVVRGRVLVESREDVVWVLAAAIGDGFDFGLGWTNRASAFGRDKPYSFALTTIYTCARQYAGGDVAGLIADARALAARANAPE
jgi:hypothetical protein